MANFINLELKFKKKILVTRKFEETREFFFLENPSLTADKRFDLPENNVTF
jgi:hypothetical protein